MPINILRLNHAPSSHPNDRIAFIKPLPRPPRLQAEYTHADTFLHAIAAQCLPIMKNHHLSCTTLEEYEPNREFIGRNFNNGEVIQLVLRRRDDSWMSFRQVQMVMMHELAHNVQMNHGKAFWAERNRFTAELKGLWDKNYTGEGFWGSGRSLENLSSHAGNMVHVGEGRDVESLCGGTFRSKGRKRRRGNPGGKGALTWKEQRNRRFEKKFGKNGVALGEDEDARIKLEISRRGPLGGKPRVAGSKRGRELRAAAALARLDVEIEPDKVKGEEQAEHSLETDDGEYGAVEADAPNGKAATDINGNRLLDSMGFGMTRVCGDEDIGDDVDVKKEMEDFETLESHQSPIQQKPQHSIRWSETSPGATESPGHIPQMKTPHSSDMHHSDHNKRALYSIPQYRAPPSSTSPLPKTPYPHRKSPSPAKPPPRNPIANQTPTHSTIACSPPSSTSTTSPTKVLCPLCSTLNNPHSDPTCTACSHVLDRRKDPRAWSCTNRMCRGSEYVNAGDCGVCGGCGERRGNG